MPPATFENPELVDLFTPYTARPDSIGAHLAQATARQILWVTAASNVPCSSTRWIRIDTGRRS